jgi:hypothetical protein
MRVVNASWRAAIRASARGERRMSTMLEADRVGSRQPLTLAGWDVEGVSVAGQVSILFL